jgi:hypothetical protein
MQCVHEREREREREREKNKTCLFFCSSPGLEVRLLH